MTSLLLEVLLKVKGPYCVNILPWYPSNHESWARMGEENGRRNQASHITLTFLIIKQVLTLLHLGYGHRNPE
jgi:hypothetical protein